MKPTAIAGFLLVLAGCLPVGCADHADHAGEAADPIADHAAADGSAALARLLEGNERYRSGTPRHEHEGFMRRRRLVAGQHPFAVVLGCADSRVPPELVFDHGLGDLFVIRVAGNVVAEDEAGSIEYAVEHLQVSLVLVLGHEGCGAVTAALGAIDAEPEELVTLLRRVRPALEQVDRSLSLDGQLAQGVEANVRQSVQQLEDVIARAHVTRGVRVVGAVYDLDTGAVEVLP